MLKLLVTKPNSNLGKVILSEACVKNSVHSGGCLLRLMLRAVRILLECILVTKPNSNLGRLYSTSPKWGVSLVLLCTPTSCVYQAHQYLHELNNQASCDDS